MDVDVFPLAEVDLKVGDVAINFDNDDMEKRGYGVNDQVCNSGIYNDYQMQNSFIKQEPDYEGFNVHFLSTNNPKQGINETSRRFQCEDCGKYFVRNEHLKNHKRIHTGERPYECDTCQRTFAKHFDLTRHKQYVHGSVMQFFICEECGRTFSRKDHLKSHLVIHKNQTGNNPKEEDISTFIKAFTCETCGRTYCRIENLKKHMEKHLESANFITGNMAKETKVDDTGMIGNVNYHFMSGNETGNNRSSSDQTGKHHPCEFCGRLFSRKDHLKNHERTHTGERPFQCSQCDRRFTKRFVMTRHVQNVHRINIKLYNCTECDRQFTRNDHLKIHMKIHILKAMRNQQRDKIYKCNICERIFNRSDNLKAHMKTHTIDDIRLKENNEREQIETGNYICEICNANFSTALGYQEHEKIHPGNSR